MAKRGLLVHHATHQLTRKLLGNALVHIYQRGTVTPITGLWNDDEGGTAVTSPIVTDDRGRVLVYADDPQSVTLRITDNGGQAYYPDDPNTPVPFAEYSQDADIHPPPAHIAGIWVNVKAFGAKGDGVTDDRAAIQAAIDFVRASGGVVFFPLGLYKVFAALIMRQNVVLVGATSGLLAVPENTSTTIRANGDHAIIDATGYVSGSTLRLRHLSLSGPDPLLEVAPRTGIGVDFADALQTNILLDFHDVHFIGLKWGIRTARRMLLSLFVDCTWQRCDIPLYGTYTGFDQNANVWIRCRWNPGNDRVMQFAGTGWGWHFIDAHVEHVQTVAVDLPGIENVTFDESWFEGLGLNGTSPGVIAGSGLAIRGGAMVRLAGHGTDLVQMPAGKTRVTLDGVRVAGTGAKINLNGATRAALRNCLFPAADTVINDSGVHEAVGNINYPDKGAGGPPLVLGAGDFETLSGTPALGTVGGGRRTAWLLDAAATEQLGTTIRIPPQLTKVKVTLLWTNAGAGAGDVVWDVYLPGFADGASLNVADSAAGSATAVAPAQDVLKVTTISTSFTVPAGAMHNVRVVRNAAHAADTLPNDAALLALIIEPAVTT